MHARGAKRFTSEEWKAGYSTAKQRRDERNSKVRELDEGLLYNATYEQILAGAQFTGARIPKLTEDEEPERHPSKAARRITRGLRDTYAVNLSVKIAERALVTMEDERKRKKAAAEKRLAKLAGERRVA